MAMTMSRNRAGGTAERGSGILKDQNIFEGDGGPTQEAAANSAWGGARSLSLIHISEPTRPY